MSAKTWAMSDLESVAKTGGFACLTVVLLHRIVREAAAAFDAPNDAIVCEVDSRHASNGVTRLKGRVRWNTVKRSWGAPDVEVGIEQHGASFRVRVGAPEDAMAPGYSFAFDWTEPTPTALFPALLVCALEAMKPKGAS
jgi:hypothetical protein